MTWSGGQNRGPKCNAKYSGSNVQCPSGSGFGRGSGSGSGSEPERGRYSDFFIGPQCGACAQNFSAIYIYTIG